MHRIFTGFRALRTGALAHTLAPMPRTRHAYALLDLPAASLARRFDVHPTTAARWKARNLLPPRYAALAALAAGDVGALDAAWTGWTLRRGELISPEGIAFRPGEVLAIPIRMQQIAALQRDTRPESQRELF